VLVSDTALGALHASPNKADAITIFESPVSGSRRVTSGDVEKPRSVQATYRRPLSSHAIVGYVFVRLWIAFGLVALGAVPASNSVSSSIATPPS